MTCTACGRTVETGAQFCSGCGQALMVNTCALSRPEQLLRPREGRMIAGVCAGFAQRYQWDVALVRLILVLAVIFGVGTPLLVYLIAWIVMPNGQLHLPAQTGVGADGGMRGGG
ncbi:MAG: PspC domain-containing protein [Janthinobacterium lividum]